MLPLESADAEHQLRFVLDQVRIRMSPGPGLLDTHVAQQCSAGTPSHQVRLRVSHGRSANTLRRSTFSRQVGQVSCAQQQPRRFSSQLQGAATQGHRSPPSYAVRLAQPSCTTWHVRHYITQHRPLKSLVRMLN